MKYLFLFLYIYTIPSFLSAKKINSPNDQTMAICLIGITTDEKLGNEFQKSAKLPDSFFEIDLERKVLPSPESSTMGMDGSNQIDENTLIKWLNNQKVGQQILVSYFNRQEDGSFNFVKCIENGLLDSQKIDKIFELSDKRGNILSEVESLDQINQTFLLIFHFYNLHTMEDDYEKNEVEKDSRILNGFIVSFDTYLIKFDFNNAIAAKFFRDYWNTEESVNMETKSEAFEKTEFPFFIIWAKKNEIAAVQQNQTNDSPDEIQMSKNELMKRLIALSVKEEGSFVTDNMVTGIKPISAEWGKKENIKFDRSYSIYENHINKDGKLLPKRMGIVKAMKIVNNKDVQNKTTETSTFYQISGRKIDNYGMYLKEKKNIGINLYMGDNLGGIKNTIGRFEYYFSRNFNDSYEPGKMAKGLTSIKIYIEGCFNEKSYLLEGNNEDFKFIRGSIGINKDYYPFRFLHWGPFLGYGMEYAKMTDSQELISTNFVETGVRLGINIFSGLQIIGSFNKYFLIKTVWMNAERDVVSANCDYSLFFPDRKKYSLSLGLRVML